MFCAETSFQSSMRRSASRGNQGNITFSNRLFSFLHQILLSIPFAEIIIVKKNYSWDIVRSRRECFILLERIRINVFETNLLQTEPSRTAIHTSLVHTDKTLFFVCTYQHNYTQVPLLKLSYGVSKSKSVSCADKTVMN